MTTQRTSATPMHRPVEVGLFLPAGDIPHVGCITRWADLVAVAIRAEERGFDSLWLADHLLLDFDPETEPVGVWECWSLLSALAAATCRDTAGLKTTRWQRGE